MQIMNLEKFFKNIWWFVSAYKTMDDLPDSLIFVDASGFIYRANKKACDCFEISNKESVSLKFDDLFVNGMDALNISSRDKKPVMVKAVTPNGEFFAEVNAIRRWDGYCVVARNISKLTQELLKEEKISQINTEKNAMLVKIEEDIKSSITSLMGFSQGLLDGIGGNLTDKQAKYVKIIQANSSDLYAFMDKFLEFSYVESFMYEPDYAKFDIIETSKAVIEDIKAVNKGKEYLFEYSAMEGRTISTDRKAIEKILRSIIGVASEMVDVNGTVGLKIFPIWTNPDDKSFGFNSIKIVVQDNGVGISAEELKYVDEPYAQLDANKKNFLRSIKLGIASILTKRAGGKMNISSEVGVGTCYEVLFPVVKDENE